MELKKREYRYCRYVLSEELAIFHRWADRPKKNGVCEGEEIVTVGILEFEDGTVREMPPEYIHFLDYKQFQNEQFLEDYEMDGAKKKVTIRNSAGILHVEIEREISLRDAMYGSGEDKLPPLTRPRLEFHKRRNGDILVSLFDQTNVFPASMYLFFVDGDEIKAYIGRVDGEERDDDSFVTWEDFERAD